MSTVYPDRKTPRSRAGCPPVLAADQPHNDVMEPAVEWPPAPPTRRTRHTSTRTRDRVIDVTDDATQVDGDRGDETVAQLTAGRAVRLLDAAIAHMRTVLETSPDESAAACVEQALDDVSRASEGLRSLLDETADDA